MSARRWIRSVAAAALVAGLVLSAEGLWLRAKAHLAEVLIARAFDAHLVDGRPHRPWGWADHHPIARLEVPRLGVTRHVLTGASGNSMAFGVGHIDGTAPPNHDGHCVLAGHRNTWLGFLRDVRVGDVLRLHTLEGERVWIVRDLSVVSERDARVVEPDVEPRLTLLTCYPFGGLPRSRRRFVVTAEPLRPPGPQTARIDESSLAES